MTYIIECSNLTKKFKGKTALNSIDYKIPRGRIVGLLGPNGSGKTTFIKICNSLLTPTKGEIFIDGKEPGKETKAIVSYLPEGNYLNDWMNVRAIIGLFNDFYKDFDSKKAYQLLKDLNINPNDKFKNMSKVRKSATYISHESRCTTISSR